MTSLIKQSYLEQKAIWPNNGRHILAQYDDSAVVVYQAYKPSIGKFAAAHNYFGGEFKFERMSWIKPNFLWMMYRSGWGTKKDQEITLAIWLKRSFFDSILEQAVPSSFDPSIYSTHAEWQKAVKSSEVRLQWDPDHGPSGHKEERRAIQLGLRGSVLNGFKGSRIYQIEDISDFVAEQRPHVKSKDYERLMTPRERVYEAPSSDKFVHLRLDVP